MSVIYIFFVAIFNATLAFIYFLWQGIPEDTATVALFTIGYTITGVGLIIREAVDKIKKEIESVNKEVRSVTDTLQDLQKPKAVSPLGFMGTTYSASPAIYTGSGQYGDFE